MEKSEDKSDIDIFEENRELKQENVELKKENAKQREEIRTLKEQIQKISTTSMGKNPSAGEMEKSAPVKKESTKVPAWFPDVLDWIKRAELALSSLSTASWTFNQYCWRKLHGKVKARIVPKLTFSHEFDEEGNCRAKLRVKGNDVFIPIASTNPPEYIAGFKKIKFYFMDERVLQFIRSILPLLNEIKIEFDNVLQNIGSICRLLSLIVPKTFKLHFEGCSHYELSDFAQQFPNALDKIQAISRFIYGDSDVDLLAKWLATPSDDGKLKCLYTNIFRQSDAKKLFDQVEKEFLNSMEPANLIVFFEWSDIVDLPIFIIENEGTNEILESYKKQDSDNETEHFLVRHQKGGEGQRANWEEEFNRKSDKTILML